MARGRRYGRTPARLAPPRRAGADPMPPTARPTARSASVPLLGLSLGLLAAGLAAGCSRIGAASVPRFRTAAVERGDVVQAIEATGTVQPEEVVDIGARVTGQILSFGTAADGQPVDYGSQVKAGQVLARIDDAPFALAL